MVYVGDHLRKQGKGSEDVPWEWSKANKECIIKQVTVCTHRADPCKELWEAGQNLRRAEQPGRRDTS